MLHTRSTEFFSIASLMVCTVMWGAPSAQPLRIVADSNRDGVVEFESDSEGRDTWTPQRGAIFYNNNNDDDRSGKPDNEDEIINGEADLDDLAKILIQTMPNVGADATLTVSVDSASENRVRLFQRNGDGEYSVFDHTADGNLDASRIAGDHLELRMEALTYADASWSGETTVTVTLENGGSETQTDRVVLRVAPWIMLSNINEVKTVYIREYPDRNDEMVADLNNIVENKANARLFAVGPVDETGYPANNIWMQDTMEIGYHAGPNGYRNVVLRANRNKPLDNFPLDELMGSDYGTFRVGDFRPAFGAGTGGNSWLDWFGNLEVTPPLPGFPLGRVIYGADGTSASAPSLDPRIVEMIDAQGVQGPALAIDVGWLLIKHADEVLSFLPSTDPQSTYKVMVPDTGVGISLFEKFQEDGHGSLQIFQPYNYRTTVDGLLAQESLLEYNRNLQRDRIEPLIDRLKDELGLEEHDLIRVPFLQNSSRTALIPNMVNSLVVNGHLVASDPTGPVVDGTDLLQAWFREAVADTGLEVHFVNDWRYHSWSGNVHCATNATRVPYELPWWDALEERSGD
ncbi:MAG: hypothetical protein JJU11_00430 [Candidatus Sumerlaeia bacterium]|nr:hypothetical protein [Candidatus Sumerlaeia bacterium]